MSDTFTMYVFDGATRYHDKQDRSKMLVTWSLFATWQMLNVLDLGLSFVAIQSGATEVGVLYQVSGSWSSMAINKIVLALLIGGALVYFRRNSWLAMLSTGMAGIFCAPIGGRQTGEMTIDDSKNLDRLFKPKPGELVVVCAWCGKEIRRKSDDGQTGISHGICRSCLKKLK